jgi:hypothetical protein
MLTFGLLLYWWGWAGDGKNWGAIMKLSNVAFGVAAAVFGLASSASAGVVYSNPYDGSGNGDCSWSTTCAAAAFRGDDFAAQSFTLTSATVITGASFEEVPGISTGGVTSVNWGFILADGAAGLPGTIVSAGSSTVTSYGAGSNGSIEGFFGVGPQALGPGTYYFALQGVSASFTEYLAEGMGAGGAANTGDGGASWAAGYYCQGGGQCMPSVAVSLFSGGVPEPATWALMLTGFGTMGAAMRLRRKQSAEVPA